MRLLQAVRNQAARIASHIEDSNLFTHMGDRGAVREKIISDFLRPFLPDCYGLGGGEVFSAEGSQSHQIDIVIYDAVFSTVLFRDTDKMLFPAESVLGSIEVKSNLNQRELSTAIDNIKSLKQLPRPDSDMMDLLPFSRLDVGHGLGFDPVRRNPYLGFIFGYRGISPDLVTTELNERLSSNPSGKQDLPDLVFSAHPGYMVARMHTINGQRSVQGPGKNFDTFEHFMTGDDTLPLFYIGMNIALNNIRLRSVDYSSLWRQVFSQTIARMRHKEPG